MKIISAAKIYGYVRTAREVVLNIVFSNSPAMYVELDSSLPDRWQQCAAVLQEQTAVLHPSGVCAQGGCVFKIYIKKYLLGYLKYLLAFCIGLQALIQTTDLHIYKELTKGNEEDTFLKGYGSFNLRLVCMYVFLSLMIHTMVSGRHNKGVSEFTSGRFFFFFLLKKHSLLQLQ